MTGKCYSAGVGLEVSWKNGDTTTVQDVYGSRRYEGEEKEEEEEGKGVVYGNWQE
jgi:hypothetical protein